MPPKENKTLGSKLKELSTYIGATCAIVSFLWIGFKEYNQYNSQKEDYPLLKKTVEIQTKQIDSLTKAVIRLNVENISDDIRINLSHELIASDMEDYIYDGVRLKRSLTGKYFYYNNGVLFKAAWDQASNKFYYIAEDGKTYWCR